MENELKQLIKKYLQGVATPEEQQLVESYYYSVENKDSYIESLSEHDQAELEKRMLNKIYLKIGNNEVRSEEDALNIPLWRKPLLKFAAAVTGLLIIALSYKMFIAGSSVILSTKYGEIKTYTLPDSSKVTLNANSMLEYKNWEKDEPRVVSLRGEAYFSVTHKLNNQPFVVKTPQRFQIEVLGTEFNVHGRKKNAKVVLTKGKVRLSFKANVRETVVMKPGEMVEIEPEKNSYRKTAVNPLIYSSWKDKKLMFDNTSLADIVEIIENIYGFKVEVKDPALLSKTFSGSVPNEDKEMLFLGLSKAFDLKVIKKNNHFEITK